MEDFIKELEALSVCINNRPEDFKYNEPGYNHRCVEHICYHYKIKREVLTSEAKPNKLSNIRRMLAVYAKRNTSYTLEKIGNMIGKNHAAALFFIRTHNGFIETNQKKYIKMYQEFISCI